MSDLTYNDMLNAYAAYPAPIRPYLLRAETHPLIRPQLTKLGIRVLIDLLARTPIRDTMKPIMVKVDNVAEQLNVSTKTVGRVIRLMLSSDWLLPTTTHDGRDNNGKFSWREFIVGTPLRRLLGLPTTPHAGHSHQAPEDTSHAPVKDLTPQQNAPSIAGRIAPTDPITTLVSTPIAEIEENVISTPIFSEICRSETILSDGLIGVNKCIKKEASPKEAPQEDFTPIQPPKREKVPQGLTELHTVLGISPRGIFKLMRLAKSKGQWLQNVWAAKGNVMLNAGAFEGRAVAYFEFLLNTGEDFDYVARCKGNMPLAKALDQFNAGAHNQRPNAPVVNQVVSLEDKLLAIAKQCRFKKFRHVSNGMRVKMHDGAAEVTWGQQSEIYAGEQMHGLYKGIANGNLVEVME
ncbi:hypothetical protein [Massilia antarctica]|uniref:hypothetical protein n=1 Tax=Massilia antarctica TaxID=2765360 RepID=UPI0036D42788